MLEINIIYLGQSDLQWKFTDVTDTTVFNTISTAKRWIPNSTPASACNQVWNVATNYEVVTLYVRKNSQCNAPCSGVLGNAAGSIEYGLYIDEGVLAPSGVYMIDEMAEQGYKVQVIWTKETLSYSQSLC